MSEPNRIPAPLKRPAHWSNDPVPTPEPVVATPEHGGRKDGLDPTRYGDWESKGIAIDF